MLVFTDPIFWWVLGDRVLGGYVLEDLDALPATARVAVFVLRPSARVRHAHRLDRHGVGPFVVVRHAARPLDRSVGKARVATGPDTQPEIHRRLWEIFAAVCVGVHERPDDGAIDIPIQLLR